MWLTAALVVVFFLAVVASIIALNKSAPVVRQGWRSSVERAETRRALSVSPTEKVSPPISASEREVSAVSEFISPPENSAETAVADALARLILADELDVTTAVKIGCGKKSGEGYQKWSRLIRAAMERQKEQATPIAGRPTPAEFAPLERPR